MENCLVNTISVMYKPRQMNALALRWLSGGRVRKTPGVVSLFCALTQKNHYHITKRCKNVKMRQVKVNNIGLIHT
jgi:hypothetical protein